MNLKRIFVTGIIFLLPTVITIFIIIVAFNFLNNNFASPIGSLIVSGLHALTGLALLKRYALILSSIIGFLFVLMVVMVIGYLTYTFLGRRLLELVERYVVRKFPIVNLIYPHAKQFIDIFLGKDKKSEFKAVVAVEYPRQGLYCLGFLTSDGLKAVKAASGKELVTVFIPSSPTPFTGYTVMFPKEDIMELQMSIDDAIRFIVSGGILHGKE